MHRGSTIILFIFVHRACLCPWDTIWAWLSFRWVRERGTVTPSDQNELVNSTREVKKCFDSLTQNQLSCKIPVYFNSFFLFSRPWFFPQIYRRLFGIWRCCNKSHEPSIDTSLYTSWNLCDEFFNWFYRAAREIYGKELKIKILHKIAFWIGKKS